MSESSLFFCFDFQLPRRFVTNTKPHRKRQERASPLPDGLLSDGFSLNGGRTQTVVTWTLAVEPLSETRCPSSTP
jgi:hypothetical protein